VKFVSKYKNAMYQNVVGFFITWTCYGTYLPGDDRGWTAWHQGDQSAQPLLERWCRDQMVETPVLLDARQRNLVNKTVDQHCNVRGWVLHALNCRTNHCHVVVTAPGYSGEQVRNQLKSWCTRRLKEHQRETLQHGKQLREHWWTKKGSVRQLFNEDSIHAAIAYTLDAQEKGGSKANES